MIYYSVPVLSIHHGIYLWLENILKRFYFTCYWSIRKKKVGFWKTRTRKPARLFLGPVSSPAHRSHGCVSSWLFPVRQFLPPVSHSLPPWSPAPAWLPPTYRIKILSAVLIVLSWVRRWFFSNKSRIWKLGTYYYMLQVWQRSTWPAYIFLLHGSLALKKVHGFCMSESQGRNTCFFLRDLLT